MFPGQTMWTYDAIPGAHRRGENDRRIVLEAFRLYERALVHGWWRRLWATLTRRRPDLLDLSDVERTCALKDRHYAGIQTVRLSQIRGSEGRCHDFDAAFHPNRQHCRNRWVAIAAAYEQGLGMPPVSLVQVGAVYYVLDGHHRVSVARALGREYIEAEVVVWQVADLTTRPQFTCACGTGAGIRGACRAGGTAPTEA
jgi:hypothetical protein